MLFCFGRPKGVAVAAAAAAAEQLFLTRPCSNNNNCADALQNAGEHKRHEAEAEAEPQPKPKLQPNGENETCAQVATELLETETSLTNKFDSRLSGRHAAAAQAAAAATQNHSNSSRRQQQQQPHRVSLALLPFRPA